MFGIFRLILAMMVASSHVFDVGRVNVGVVAVVGFYLLSGYLMAAVFVEKFGESKSRVRGFYWDRVLRIWPAYIVFLCLAVWVVGDLEGFSWKENFWGWLAQITIVPLNYYQLVDLRVVWETTKPLIPQAWSLGSELQFYLLLPWLVLWPGLRRVVLLASFGWFVIVGLTVRENTQMWGYILPMASMWVFVLGVELYRWQVKKDVVGKKLVSLSWVMAGAMLVLAASGRAGTSGRFFEMMLGYWVWLPVVMLLAMVGQKKGLDGKLGELSYGVFLGHSSVFYWMTPVGSSPGMPLAVSEGWKVLVMSLVLSWMVVVLVERPIKKMRVGFRRKLN